MSQNWEMLPLPKAAQHPALLFRYTTSHAGYLFYLTDLTLVWSESLSRQQILDEAGRNQTSIDPSEDNHQYQVFLNKIEDALHGIKGSSISLAPSSNGEGVRLATTTKLPQPLDPLEWCFHLKRQPQSALALHVLIPELKAEQSLKERVQSLVDLLKEKDWVLSKVLDKIETLGFDLGTVFPGLVDSRISRKGASLSDAAKKIKGLTPFDEQMWNAGFTGHDPGTNVGTSIVRALAESQDSIDLKDLKPAPEDWWRRPILMGQVDNHQESSNKKLKRQPTLLFDEHQSGDDDDEFQRQETPPNLRKGLRGPSAARGSDYELLPAHVQESGGQTEGIPEPSSSRRAKQRGKGLGPLGRKSQAKTEKQSFPISTKSDESSLRQPKAGRVRERLPSASETSDNEGETPRARSESTASEAVTASDIDERSPPATAAVEQETDVKDNGRQREHSSRTIDEGGPQPKKATAFKTSRIGGLSKIGGRKKHKEEKCTPSTSPEPVEGQFEIEQRSVARDEKPRGDIATTLEPSRKAKGIFKLGRIGRKKDKLEPTSRLQLDEPNRQDTALRIKGATEAGSVYHEGAQNRRDNRKASTTLMQHRLAEVKAEEKPKEEAPVETPESKAGRKREELRRQLEARSSGPVKKKRRF